MHQVQCGVQRLTHGHFNVWTTRQEIKPSHLRFVVYQKVIGWPKLRRREIVVRELEYNDTTVKNAEIGNFTRDVSDTPKPCFFYNVLLPSKANQIGQTPQACMNGGYIITVIVKRKKHKFHIAIQNSEVKQTRDWS